VFVERERRKPWRMLRIEGTGGSAADGTRLRQAFGVAGFIGTYGTYETGPPEAVRSPLLSAVLGSLSTLSRVPGDAGVVTGRWATGWG
jgi:hypothetical protein